MKRREVPVVARISKQAVLFDARTLADDDLPEAASAVRAYFEEMAAAEKGEGAGA